MSQMRVARTVLGDVDPTTLGVLDYHEHLFQRSPMLPGEELDDERRSGEEARHLFDAGVRSMIDATPTGLGRDVEAAARISVETGLQIIHTTGAHHSGHYPSDAPLLHSTRLAERFIADIRDGFTLDDGSRANTPAGLPIRAGIAKAGIRYWSIGTFERRTLDAVAEASSVTGCAVMVHLDFGSAAHEVLDILELQGVGADRVVLAHIDRNLDPGLHTSLAQRGAYLGYDGMARHKDAPDSAILACLEASVAGGAGDRIVLGGDVARRSRYLAYGGMPGLSYLPLRFLPRLAGRIDRTAYSKITVENAARLLAMPDASA